MNGTKLRRAQREQRLAARYAAGHAAAGNDLRAHAAVSYDHTRAVIARLPRDQQDRHWAALRAALDHVRAQAETTDPDAGTTAQARR